MGILQTIVVTLFVYSMAFYTSGIVLAHLFMSILLHPTRLFWRVRQRQTPPECLTDPAYGIHGYLPIEVHVVNKDWTSCLYIDKETQGTACPGLQEYRRLSSKTSLTACPQYIPQPYLQHMTSWGAKIHYVEKGDRSKPLMLFIHGFPEFWYSWRHQLKEFSKDYWTVAIDMRGFGDSDKPNGIEHYKMPLLINDIKEIIEALGHDKCTLVAHDYGGAIAWNFILKYPEMLDNYIILDAPYSPSNLRILTSNLFQVAKSWDIFFYQLPYLPELMFRSYDLVRLKHLFRGSTPKSLSPVTNEDVEAYKYTFGKSGAFTPPINYFRANGFTLSLPKDQLKKNIEAQGLYMFGEHDNHYVFDHLWSAQNYMKNLKVNMVKGANHFAQQDDPEKVNTLIREFLKGKHPTTTVQTPVETLSS